MKKQLLIILFLSLGFIGTTSAGEVETNILQLKALNSCESCNLQGAELNKVDLSGAILYSANLSKAILLEQLYVIQKHLGALMIQGVN